MSGKVGVLKQGVKAWPPWSSKQFSEHITADLAADAKKGSKDTPLPTGPMFELLIHSPESGAKLTLTFPRETKPFPKNNRLVYSHTVTDPELAGQLFPFKGYVHIMLLGELAADFDYSERAFTTLQGLPADSRPDKLWVQLNDITDAFAVQLQLKKLSELSEHQGAPAYAVSRAVIQMLSLTEPAPAAKEPKTDLEKAASV
jgi:hypothetical protein